jgi:hypothetical protein
MGRINLAEATAISTGITTYAPKGETIWGHELGIYYRELYSLYYTATE